MLRVPPKAVVVVTVEEAGQELDAGRKPPPSRKAQAAIVLPTPLLLAVVASPEAQEGLEKPRREAAAVELPRAQAKLMVMPPRPKVLVVPRLAWAV